MRLALAAVVFTILSISVFAHGLEEYPEMFVSNGKVNAIVVVDDGVPAHYVVTQTGIVLSLNEEAGTQQQGVAKLSSEVPVLKHNTISIGNPCENKVSEMILKNGEDCSKGFKRGWARIELVYDETTHLTHIVAGGYTQKGTLEAANRLKDATKNRFGEFTIIEFGVNESLDNEKESEEVHDDIIQKDQNEEQAAEERNRDRSPASEPSSGQQEAAEAAKADSGKEAEGIFQQFFIWIRSLFG